MHKDFYIMNITQLNDNSVNEFGENDYKLVLLRDNFIYGTIVKLTDSYELKIRTTRHITFKDDSWLDENVKRIKYYDELTSEERLYWLIENRTYPIFLYTSDGKISVRLGLDDTTLRSFFINNYTQKEYDYLDAVIDDVYYWIKEKIHDIPDFDYNMGLN